MAKKAKKKKTAKKKVTAKAKSKPAAKKTAEPLLLLDGNRGVYIPRDFVAQWWSSVSNQKDFDKETPQDLTSPDNEFYWESWDDVLRKAVLVIDGNKYTLNHDDDLWAEPEGWGEEEQKIHNFIDKNTQWVGGEGEMKKGGRVAADAIPENVYWALYHISPKLVDAELHITKAGNSSYDIEVGKVKEGEDQRSKGYSVNIEKTDGKNERIVFEWLAKNNYKKGERLKSALMRDRKYISEEEHEQAYKPYRADRRPRYYQKDDGWFGKGGENKGMKPQPGQIKDLKKLFPSIDSDSIEIIAEGGNDNGSTFSGSFLAKIKGKGTFRITDGKLINKLEKGGYLSGVTATLINDDWDTLYGKAQQEPLKSKIKGILTEIFKDKDALVRVADNYEWSDGSNGFINFSNLDHYITDIGYKTYADKPELLNDVEEFKKHILYNYATAPGGDLRKGEKHRDEEYDSTDDFQWKKGGALPDKVYSLCQQSTVGGDYEPMFTFHAADDADADRKAGDWARYQGRSFRGMNDKHRNMSEVIARPATGNELLWEPHDEYMQLAMGGLIAENDLQGDIHAEGGQINDLPDGVRGRTGETDYPRFHYMMLSRLQSDCEYFLGFGARGEERLWAHNIDAHIAEMKRLWNLLPVKPEWLSMEQILYYENKMKGGIEKFAIGDEVSWVGWDKATSIGVVDDVASTERGQFVWVGDEQFPPEELYRLTKINKQQGGIAAQDKNALVDFQNEGVFEKGGANGNRYYVKYSSWFDTHPYDVEKIKNTIHKAGGTSLALSKQYGWQNQPYVVTFRATPDKIAAITQSIQNALNTEWITIHEQDWNKREDGGIAAQDKNALVDFTNDGIFEKGGQPSKYHHMLAEQFGDLSDKKVIAFYQVRDTLKRILKNEKFMQDVLTYIEHSRLLSSDDLNDSAVKRSKTVIGKLDNLHAVKQAAKELKDTVFIESRGSSGRKAIGAENLISYIEYHSIPPQELFSEKEDGGIAAQDKNALVDFENKSVFKKGGKIIYKLDKRVKVTIPPKTHVIEYWAYKGGNALGSKIFGSYEEAVDAINSNTIEEVYANIEKPVHLTIVKVPADSLVHHDRFLIHEFENYEQGGIAAQDKNALVDFENEGIFKKGGDIRVLPDEYYQTFKMPKIRGRVGIGNAYGTSTTKAVMRRIFPDMTKKEHLARANKYKELYEAANAKRWKEIEKAFKKQFGREYELTDYRVSGIARDEFPEKVKDRIRAILHEEIDYRNAFDAHNAMLTQKMKLNRAYAEGGELTDDDRLKIITDNYIEAALWSSNNSDAEDESFNGYAIIDVAPETRKFMESKVRKFITDNIEVIKESGTTDEQLGHDIWLSSNGHGAGFFDRGYDDEVEKKLMKAARELGGMDLYVGDDGKIHALQENSHARGGDIKNTELITEALQNGEAWSNDLRTWLIYKEGRLGITRFFGKNREASRKTTINNASELPIKELNKKVQEEIKKQKEQYEQEKQQGAIS